MDKQNLMETFISDQNFKIWEYTVSHSILLLRYHEVDSDKVVDIIFEGVEFLQIPEKFIGLEILEASEAENGAFTKYLKPSPPKPASSKIYVLVTSNIRYYVVASFCHVYEHNNSYIYGIVDYWNKTGQVQLIYEDLNPAALEWKRKKD